MVRRESALPWERARSEDSAIHKRTAGSAVVSRLGGTCIATSVWLAALANALHPHDTRSPTGSILSHNREHVPASRSIWYRTGGNRRTSATAAPIAAPATTSPG